VEWRHAFAVLEQTVAWRGFWETERAPWSTALHYADAREWQPRRYRIVGSRPCPACTGTGRESIPIARLLLDAAQPCSFCEDVGDVGTLHRRPCLHCLPRQSLRAHADRLQAEGDPRGELLALALGPWSYPSITMASTDSQDVYANHAGTAAALRWLEWLTWAREFDGGYAAALASGVVANRAEFEALRRAAHGAALTADRLIPDNLGIDLAGRPQGRLPLTVPRW
jgi:hypothetical protein